MKERLRRLALWAFHTQPLPIIFIAAALVLAFLLFLEYFDLVERLFTR